MPARHVLFLVDESDSMRARATSGGPSTRFQDALQGVRAVLATLTDTDSAGLYTFAGSLMQVSALAQLSGSRAALLTSLDRMGAAGPVGGASQLYPSILHTARLFQSLNWSWWC